MEEGTRLPAKMNNLYIYQCCPFTQNKIKTWFKKLINKHKYKHILFLYYIFKLFPFTCGRFTVLLSNKVNLNTTDEMLPHSPFYKTANKDFNIVSMVLTMLISSWMSSWLNLIFCVKSLVVAGIKWWIVRGPKQC